jgi:hypothetical protein
VRRAGGSRCGLVVGGECLAWLGFDFWRERYGWMHGEESSVWLGWAGYSVVWYSVVLVLVFAVLLSSCEPCVHLRVADAYMIPMISLEY